ncbi:MAG TPA: hypothetical protein VGH54_21305 [Mycobacterium sp.]|jgi:hypothetical protein|uniref:hypothetical protein n=1 Tax=Mycobacterium sp. TaxID=1785 RepID=UPI002F4239AE
MPELHIILSVADGDLAPYMTPGQEPEAMATFEVVGCLPGGMTSGLPSFVAVVELPSGERILAETSWRNMALALVALAAKWGKP